MVTISSKASTLQQVFKLLNTRGFNKIDANELFTVILFMAKGEYENVMENLTQIFSYKQQGVLYRDEFFYFLDCFFRGVSNILLLKNEKYPKNQNWRLNPDQCKLITDSVFAKNIFIQGHQLHEFISQGHPQFYQFTQYIYKELQDSISYAKQEQLKLFKISMEVKACMGQLLSNVQKLAT